jgi:hypothetical protein
MATGKIRYIPSVVVDEVEDIRRENNVYDQAEAMKQLIKYARVGREMERIMKLKWNKAAPRKSVEEFFR